MNDFENLRVERTRPGVMTVVFDAPGRSVNVVDESLLQDLSALVDRLEQDRAVHLVVFRSGKPSGFLAGADVKRIRQIASPQEADRMLRAGQELFDRIAGLPMPTVAVIHGPCLGGGLEFALACRFRVARDDSTTRVGCPETQLGLIPGWGGTQRLPRLVGLSRGLRMILEGQRLPAAKAQSLGLIDLAIPAERFEETLHTFLTERLAGKPVRRPRRRLSTRLLDETWLGQHLVDYAARRELGRRRLEYPALDAALRAVATGIRRGHVSGLEAEREGFCRVLFTSTCRNLLELFFLREQARKAETWLTGCAVSPSAVDSVAVIGAGTMGAGIAQLAAYQGLKVVLKDLRDDIVSGGLERIAALMSDAVKSGSISADEAERRRHAVTGATDWAALATIDIAIEAVVEQLEIKREVFRELDRRLLPETPIVSNTSSLAIGDLAAATQRADRVAGLHFFNPVHRMQLVEVVRSKTTSDQTIATLVGLVRQLGKVPIVVADGPGFLVNRILYPYLDEAVRLVCEGVHVDEVDRRAVSFGMPVGPLELLDQVGIDVAADVAHTLTSQGAEAGPTPERLAMLVARGRLGKKSGAGFYLYRNGRKHGVASKADTSNIHASSIAPVQFGNETLDDITQRLILALIAASASALEEQIVPQVWMVDLAMVLGTGFAPFRGGPLRLADAWGARQVVSALERLSESCGERFRPGGLLQEMSREGRAFHQQDAERTLCELVAVGDHRHANHEI